MQKINLRELYPDVYKTDVFVDVVEIARIEVADRRRVWDSIRLFIWLIICLISGLVPGGWHFFTQFSTVGWHPELYDKLR